MLVSVFIIQLSSKLSIAEYISYEFCCFQNNKMGDHLINKGGLESEVEMVFAFLINLLGRAGNKRIIWTSCSTDS